MSSPYDSGNDDNSPWDSGNDDNSPYDNGNDDNSPEEDVCREQEDIFYDCMQADGDACASCINDVLDQAYDIELACDQLLEAGFCNGMYNCYVQECNQDCQSEMIDAVACITDVDCGDGGLRAECTHSEL